jgi:methylmalonyl-CoA/ethylmalonyl-CoA epimerase
MSDALEAAPGAFDHIALIVADLESEARRYRDLFHAEISAPEHNPQYGISSVFVDLGYSRLRLLQPDGSGSGIAAFFGPHPLAGIHHVCYRVDAIEQARNEMQRRGYHPMSPAFKRSAEGKRLIFLRPPDRPGPLVKLQEQ